MKSIVAFGFEVEPKSKTSPQIKQVHGKTLVDLAKRGEGAPDADGVFTFTTDEIYVFTADCIPVLLFGESSSAPVTALHAGWRGLKSGIVTEALDRLYPAGNVNAVIGPCILGCCFEVKDDFVDAFMKDGKNISPYLEVRVAKTFCHLDRYLIEEELSALGPRQLDLSHLRCTKCSTPQLPSFRRNGVTDPRIRGWIQKQSS